MSRGSQPPARSRRVAYASWTGALVAVALAVMVGSCGGAGNRSAHTLARAATGATGEDSSHTTTGAQPKHKPFALDAEGDYDNEGKGWYDADDAKTFDYGHAAGAEDRREVTAVVERYYAAAAADDGAVACSLIYWVVAEVFAEEFGGAREQEAPCAAAASRLFRRMHRRFAHDTSSLRVTGVRVEGERARALLSFGKGPIRYIVAHRQGSAWRIYYPFDSGLS